jgi:hypothetical protein
MEKFTIAITEDTPEISIDYEMGVLEISGSSLPEDSVAFFLPIQKAVKKYIENPRSTTTINLRIKYLNSSSQKRILELVSLFHNFPEKGLNVEINWYYSEEDEDMHEEGKDFARLISLPMNIISLSKSF